MPRRVIQLPLCPCGKKMRGNKDRCGSCLRQLRNTITGLRRNITAPIATSVELRQLLSYQERDASIEVARRLTDFNEAVQEASQVTNNARRVMQQNPVYAGFFTAAVAGLHAADQNLQAEFVTTARRQSAALLNLNFNVTAPITTEPITTESRVEDVTHLTCSVTTCDNPVAYRLPCDARHTLCSVCVTQIISSAGTYDDGRARPEPVPLSCPLCRRLWMFDQLVPINNTVIANATRAIGPAATTQNVGARLAIEAPVAPARLAIEAAATNTTGSSSTDIDDLPDYESSSAEGERAPMET